MAHLADTLRLELHRDGTLHPRCEAHALGVHTHLRDTAELDVDALILVRVLQRHRALPSLMNGAGTEVQELLAQA